MGTTGNRPRDGAAGGAEAPAGPAARRLTRADEARKALQGELHEIAGTDVFAGDHEIGGRTFAGLLRVHPLTSYFCWLADRQFPESHRRATRVARLRDRDPQFYWVCVTVDTVLVVLAALGLLVAAAVVVYKTVAPLP